MPYRGGEQFSWHAAEGHDRRLRVIAAIVLLAAGWATGFFAGRMSALVLPVTAPETVELDKMLRGAATAKPEKNMHQPAGNKFTAASAPASQTPLPEISKRERSNAEDDRNGPSSPNPDSAKGDASIAPAPTDAETRTPVPPQDGEASEHATVLVNPNWDQVKPQPPSSTRTGRNEPEESREDAEEPGRVNEAGTLECERRYASFRRSDGTYQPYGGSSRRLCPFLR